MLFLPLPPADALAPVKEVALEGNEKEKAGLDPPGGTGGVLPGQQ